MLLQQNDLTLILAVRLMGLGGELILDFVIVKCGDLKEKLQKFER